MRATYQVHFVQQGKSKLQQASVETGHTWTQPPTFDQAAAIIEYHNPGIKVLEVTMMRKVQSE